MFSHFTEIQHTTSQNCDNIDVTTRGFYSIFVNINTQLTYDLSLKTFWFVYKTVVYFLQLRYIVLTSKLLAVNSNSEVKHHVYVKRQTRICTTWPSFPITCRLRFIISTHKLVVSRNFLSVSIVLSCFYLLIFYFEKFSTWTWRLPYT